MIKIIFLGIKTTLIHPATDKIIEKYRQEQNIIIQESYELYKAVTEPYVTENQHSIDWVYNVLEHKAEFERITYENPHKEEGFILLPDLKWDGINPDTFYLQALPHIRGLRSLRDLTSAHLPLLKAIYSEAPVSMCLSTKKRPTCHICSNTQVPTFLTDN